MVNSGSYEGTGSEGESVKGDFTQMEGGATTTAASPRHIVGACAREENFTATTAEMVSGKEEEITTQETAADPIATERENGLKELTLTSLLQLDLKKEQNTLPGETKTSLQCSVPLHKVKDVLGLCAKNETSSLVSNFILGNLLKKSSEPPKTDVENQKSTPKRLLCLFCDRTFTSLNLKQKHVDRCHATGQSRRFSSRTPGISQSATACWFCSKLNHTDHSLQELLEHLINEHSNRYFACLSCHERFSSTKTLREHNRIVHNIEEPKPAEKKIDENLENVEVKDETKDERNTSSPENLTKNTRKRTTRSPKEETEDLADQETIEANVLSPDVKEEQSESEDEPVKKSVPIKRNRKKLRVKSTKNGVRTSLRTTRAAVKQMNSRLNNKKRKKTNKLVKKVSEVKKTVAKSTTNSSSVFSLVNLFTYKYEKIYDHASDSIKDANSGKFDAVFDKEFYIRTVSNIKENLLFHLDGKLNRNIQSENRISNFEQIPSSSDIDSKNSVSDSNFGSDLSLNAVTPVATLLASSQYGEDFDSQIEYASKATQKKAKKDKTLKFKFTNRKYNSLFRDKGDHSDLTCLDMWTQLRIKERQHIIHGDGETISLTKQFAKDQVKELNNILDKRGPFEDLRVEALEESMKQGKNSEDKNSQSFKDVNIILEDILSGVFKSAIKEESTVLKETLNEDIKEEQLVHDSYEIPNYLNLQKSPNKNNIPIDPTDKIAMICSSQDAENPNIELSGEWARPRIYICATCALKLPNFKSLDEHKNNFHPHIWCTHYEFVGKQSEFYRHLGIPGLGKVGVVEMTPITKLWQRSDARMCSKCAKQCHNLGELHRHMLECGGDWTWMLARKKCKYRPYGARTRRRRQRGYKRSCNPDIPRVPREPKIKSTQVGPRVKPSDAETIERMLANLPAKRIRKVISMRDGIQGPRKPYMNKKKMKATSASLHNESSAKKIVSQRLKNRISQATNQALKNSLKRKMTLRTLRNRNNLMKLQSENNEKEHADIYAKKRSESKVINKNKLTAKKTMSRVLGSKILDSNATLVTRRHLVKAVLHNNLMRRTRLRSKGIIETPTVDIQETKRSTRSKETQDNKKSTKDELKNSSENVQTEVVPVSEIKNKKSAGKKLMSLFTSSSKKKQIKRKKEETKQESEEKTNEENTNKPFDILSNEDKTPESSKDSKKLRNIKETKEEQTEKNVDKPKITKKLNKQSSGGISDSASAVIDAVASNTMDQYDATRFSKIIRKKAFKLVQNVKTMKKDLKNNKSNKIRNKLTEKSVATKLIRSLSIRNSKRLKKTHEEVIVIKPTHEDSIVNVCDTSIPEKSTEDIKSEEKSVADESVAVKDSSKETTDITNIRDDNVINKRKGNETKQNDVLEVIEKVNDTSTENLLQSNSKLVGETLSKSSEDFAKMPDLEKFEPLPEDLPSVESIPILSPVYLTPLPKPPLESNVPKKIDFEESLQVKIAQEASSIPTKEQVQTNVSNVVPESTKQVTAFNKFKTKFKRSGKGLNDCIAMLKHKLEKTVEPTFAVDKSNLFILNACENRGPVVIETNKLIEKNQELMKNNEIVKLEEPNDSIQHVEKINDKKELTTVLEIPLFTKSLVPTPEPLKSPQINIENQLANSNTKFTPTDIQINQQITSVLDVAMKNCLLECVKTKCEELKSDSINKNKKNITKPIRKIGSVRKRKKLILQNKDEKTSENPRSLNEAFIEGTKSNIEGSDDDDIPLSSLVKSPLKVKKRRSKPKISFTPLILNQPQTPEIILKEKLEQHVDLDNSMNSKIETIQTKVAKEKKKTEDKKPSYVESTSTNQEIVSKVDPIIEKEISINNSAENIKETSLSNQIMRVEDEPNDVILMNKTLEQKDDLDKSSKSLNAIKEDEEKGAMENLKLSIAEQNKSPVKQKGKPKQIRIRTKRQQVESIETSKNEMTSVTEKIEEMQDTASQNQSIDESNVSPVISYEVRQDKIKKKVQNKRRRNKKQINIDHNEADIVNVSKDINNKQVFMKRKRKKQQSTDTIMSSSANVISFQNIEKESETVINNPDTENASSIISTDITNTQEETSNELKTLTKRINRIPKIAESSISSESVQGTESEILLKNKETSDVTSLSDTENLQDENSSQDKNITKRKRNKSKTVNIVISSIAINNTKSNELIIKQTENITNVPLVDDKNSQIENSNIEENIIQRKRRKSKSNIFVEPLNNTQNNEVTVENKESESEDAIEKVLMNTDKEENVIQRKRRTQKIMQPVISLKPVNIKETFLEITQFEDQTITNVAITSTENSHEESNYKEEIVTKRKRGKSKTIPPIFSSDVLKNTNNSINLENREFENPIENKVLTDTENLQEEMSFKEENNVKRKRGRQKVVPIITTEPVTSETDTSFENKELDQSIRSISLTDTENSQEELIYKEERITKRRRRKSKTTGTIISLTPVNRTSGKEIMENSDLESTTLLSTDTENSPNDVKIVKKRKRKQKIIDPVISSTPVSRFGEIVSEETEDIKIPEQITNKQESITKRTRKLKIVEPIISIKPLRIIDKNTTYTCNEKENNDELTTNKELEDIDVFTKPSIIENVDENKLKKVIKRKGRKPKSADSILDSSPINFVNKSTSESENDEIISILNKELENEVTKSIINEKCDTNIIEKQKKVVKRSIKKQKCMELANVIETINEVIRKSYEMVNEEENNALLKKAEIENKSYVSSLVTSNENISYLSNESDNAQRNKRTKRQKNKNKSESSFEIIEKDNTNSEKENNVKTNKLNNETIDLLISNLELSINESLSEEVSNERLRLKGKRNTRTKKQKNVDALILPLEENLENNVQAEIRDKNTISTDLPFAITENIELESLLDVNKSDSTIKSKGRVKKNKIIENIIPENLEEIVQTEMELNIRQEDILEDMDDKFENLDDIISNNSFTLDKDLDQEIMFEEINKEILTKQVEKHSNVDLLSPVLSDKEIEINIKDNEINSDISLTENKNSTVELADNIGDILGTVKHESVGKSKIDDFSVNQNLEKDIQLNNIKGKSPKKSKGRNKKQRNTELVPQIIIPLLKEYKETGPKSSTQEIFGKDCANKYIDYTNSPEILPELLQNNAQLDKNLLNERDDLENIDSVLPLFLSDDFVQKDILLESKNEKLVNTLNENIDPAIILPLEELIDKNDCNQKENEASKIILENLKSIEPIALDIAAEPIVLENKTIDNNSLPTSVPIFDEVPKTPTIMMTSDDSEDELPLAFLAKSLSQNTDDDILNDISGNLETPSILANNDLVLEEDELLPDNNLGDLTDLIDDKNESDLEKIDETILDLSFDIESPSKTDKIGDTNEELHLEDKLKTSKESLVVDLTPGIIKTQELLLDDPNLTNLDKTVEPLSDEILNTSDLASDFITTPDLNNTSLVIKIQKKFNCKIKKTKKTRRRVNIKPVPKNIMKQKIEDESTVIYCEICDKTFTRAENLVKHKRTLTHISKLSEIEARENEARQTTTENEDKDKDLPEEKDEDNIDEENVEEEYIEEHVEDENLENLPQNTSTESEIIEIKDEEDEKEDVQEKIEENINNEEKEINPPVETIDLIEDMSTDIEKSSESFLISTKNTKLKLVDIINDVLDKPVKDLHMAESLMSKSITTTLNESEPKRYKSLGERKSFDSDSYIMPQKSNEENEFASSKETTNQLLNKQLTLLENMIEKTNPELNYIDDSMSYSSNHFNETIAVRNISEKGLFCPTEYPIKFNEPQIKFSHNTDIISSFIKPDGHFTHFENHNESFAKPVSNYDEASQQQFQENDKNYKENISTRKILNRDEELFLECCSLLKSGSEISSVSKKSTKQIPLHNFSNDGPWVNQKQGNFIQRDSYSWLAQGSRVETPIGEPYVNNDWSNSNSAVSSEWLAQKAASPDQPVENNTLSKKTNNTDTNYSNIQFEDISVDNSENSAEKIKENIPLDFHHVKFPKNDDEFKDEIETENLDEKSINDDANVDSNMAFKDETSDEIVSTVEEEENEKVEEDEKEEDVKKEEDVSPEDEVDENLKRHVVTAFGGLMAKALKCRLKAVVRRSNKAKEKRTFISTLQPVITDYAVPMKKSKMSPQEISQEMNTSDCPKKIVTKGAMKVFEGLKVSIPTQDLDLNQVLKGKSVEPKEIITTEEEMKADITRKKNKKKNIFCNFGNKLGLRETKKKNSKKYKNHIEDKAHDIYEFEESEDNTSLFKSKSLAVFRNTCNTSKPTDDVFDNLINSEEPVNNITEMIDNKSNLDSESETDRYYDSVSFEENSFSSESVMEQSEELKLKSSSEKSLSKKDSQKKCMIMGRIFKNASKPKLEDKIPEIRDISSEENSKLVENYLETYSSIDNLESTAEVENAIVANNLTIINSANKMSKNEMDFLFDKLLHDNKNSPLPSREDITEIKTNVEKTNSHEVKTKEDKPKLMKTKKRQRHQSDDSVSTDEFTLSGKHTKSKKHKRHPRKINSKKKNGGINLEQEMKECIGVAGRKSQRKCTSGKQNVLVEFWSSDESEVDFTDVVEENIVTETVEDLTPTVENPELPVVLSEPDSKINDEVVQEPAVISEIKDLYEFEPETEDQVAKIEISVDKQKIEKHKKSMKIKDKRHSRSKDENEFEGRKTKRKGEFKKKRSSHSESSNTDSLATTRRKRNAVETLYYWSSTSDDEFEDLIEVKPIREDTEDDRPMQHGWIVGDSPKKLVTMLAQAKGKKVDCESVKEQGKKNRTTL